MDSVKIGLLGAGTIGGSVIEVLQNNRDIISQRAHTDIQIKNILVLPRELDGLHKRGLPATSNYDEILNDP
ncbi:MAG: homoserine dehydrogenase, partial [Quinella sp. 1Q7]|nr:homoserine dehydrogenase [Quinella sp. 1Q7]